MTKRPHPVITWSVAIPGGVPAKAFSHLGVTFGPSATLLSWNGFPLAKTPLTYPGLVSAGALVLGGGFRGWVDELKIVFRAPSVEEACNHAHGTIARLLPGPGAAPWTAQASSYPAWAHLLISGQLGQQVGTEYVCFHDYSRDLQQPIPPPTQGGLFAEPDALLKLPIFQFRQPRPDDSNSEFCLGCHQPSQVASTLRPGVLRGNPGVNLEDDLRRQPMRPPRIINGQVPARYGLREPGGFPLPLMPTAGWACPSIAGCIPDRQFAAGRVPTRSWGS